jgi:VWFA-related protein
MARLAAHCKRLRKRITVIRVVRRCYTGLAMSGRLLAIAVLGFTTVAVPGAARGREAEDGRLVKLRAFVTNPRGDVMGGLRSSDFELLVDGAPRKLSSLEFSTAPRPRVFAILLDEFHVAPADSAAVRDALLRFVDGLRPDDLAVVIKPLDPVTLTSIQPTADHELVRRAIERFEGRKGDFAPRTAFERTYLAHAPAAVAEARAQIVTSGVRALAARLVQLSSERADLQPAIVLVTDGFLRVSGNREVPGNLQTAIRIANRAGAAVYGFRPSPAADTTDEDEQRVVAGLKALVTETGGELTASAANLESGLRRMARDLDAHYVLAYEAPQTDNRFHSVQVTVKRRDARVRAPARHPAPVAEAARVNGSAAPPRPLRVLRRSTLIQSWSGLIRGADGRARVVLTWEPAPGRIGRSTVEPESIVVTASTLDGTVLFDDRVAPVGERREGGEVNRAEFDAPAGRLLVDMKILDRKGIVLDTESRDVDVPDLTGRRAVILPPAVIRTRSGREFRVARDDPHAAPVASRDFRRTERLLIRVSALDAGGAPAPIVASLMNRWRQPMRMLDPIKPTHAGVTQFDLPLAALAPGEYSVRLTAAGVSEFMTFRVSR